MTSIVVNTCWWLKCWSGDNLTNRTGSGGLVAYHLFDCSCQGVAVLNGMLTPVLSALFCRLVSSEVGNA